MKMRWLVWVLVLIELVAIGLALRVIPSRYADSAVLVVAVNSILLLVAVKQSRKKKDCCS